MCPWRNYGKLVTQKEASITKSMKQKGHSWQANRRLTSLNISFNSWKPEVHYLLASFRHWSLSRTTWKQTTPSQSVSWSLILMLSFHVNLDFLCSLFSSGSSTQILCEFSYFSVRSTDVAWLMQVASQTWNHGQHWILTKILQNMLNIVTIHTNANWLRGFQFQEKI
jgi:hypothetical protein